jgi:hypothetical protein
MEHLLQSLPPKPRSLVVRLTVTTAMIGGSFLLLIGVQDLHAALAFYVLFPAIFVASVLFDRGSGIYASAQHSDAVHDAHAAG